jgi:hypothetical protein
MIHRKYSLLKQTQFSQANNVLDAPVSNTDGFLKRHMCFFNSAELGYLEQNEISTNLKIVIDKRSSLQKLTQFLQATMQQMLQLQT